MRTITSYNIHELWQIMQQNRVIADLCLKDLELPLSRTNGQLFRNCEFIDVTFSEANDSALSFSQCQLRNCRFRDVQATSCLFLECQFQQCHLTEANLSACHFNRCGWQQCDLRCAGIQKSSIIESRFQECAWDYFLSEENTYVNTTFTDDNAPLSTWKSNHFIGCKHQPTFFDTTITKQENCSFTEPLSEIEIPEARAPKEQSDPQEKPPQKQEKDAEEPQPMVKAAPAKTSRFDFVNLPPTK